MRLQINLSRQPFYNRRLFWLSILVVIAITGLCASWTLTKITACAGEIQQVEAKIKQQEQQLKTLKSKPIGPDLPQSLTEAQAKQLKAAALLIEQRGFSWTSMLEQFERSLPPEVRISSISLRGDKLDEGIANDSLPL